MLVFTGFDRVGWFNDAEEERYFEQGLNSTTGCHKQGQRIKRMDCAVSVGQQCGIAMVKELVSSLRSVTGIVTFTLSL
jgi:hypothetical protein